MLKIEFDPSNTALAHAIGTALVNYSGQDAASTAAPTPSPAPAPAPAPAEQDDKPVDTSAAFSATAEQAEAEAEEETEEDTAVDDHGTPHNPKYCVSLNASKPFYGSGSNKGQWKRRPGVDQSEYNEWYASAMPIKDEDGDDKPVDTAGAFNSKPAASNDSAAPATMGELMGYISDRQANGSLTNTQIEQAYQKAGVQPAELFDVKKEADCVAKVYAVLAGI